MKVKTSKGITLIALIITIIVLLILAGVGIVMLTGDNGILTKSTEAKETNKQKSAEELVNLAIMGSYGEDGKINFGGLKKNLNNISGITGVPSEEITEESFPITVKIDGQKVKLKMSENGRVIAKAKNEEIAITPEKTTYTIGEKVKIGTESFYVIDDSEEKVTLFAEMNINTTSLKQSAEESNSIWFSSTNYWSSIEGITYPYDLNNIEPSSNNDAVAIARAYGESLGEEVTGRLLTLSEMEELAVDHFEMIFGDGVIEQKDTWFNYWLGTAQNGSEVWRALGGTFLDTYVYSYGYGKPCPYKVRPVVEIEKP